MNHYDNHANLIDYVAPHKIKVVRKDKPNFTDVANLSDNELAEKLDDVEMRIADIAELYSIAQREDTFERLLKVSSFKSVICREIRKRNLKTNAELKSEIQELEEKVKVLHFSGNEEIEKKIAKLEAANNSLKGEVAAYRAKFAKAEDKEKNNASAEKTKNLTAQIEQLKAALAQNREAEKTKRHEINVKNDKFACEYLLEYVRQLVDESEMKDIEMDLKEIREREIKELI